MSMSHSLTQGPCRLAKHTWKLSVAIWITSKTIHWFNFYLQTQKQINRSSLQHVIFFTFFFFLSLVCFSWGYFSKFAWSLTLSLALLNFLWTINFQEFVLKIHKLLLLTFIFAHLRNARISTHFPLFKLVHIERIKKHVGHSHKPHSRWCSPWRNLQWTS